MSRQLIRDQLEALKKLRMRYQSRLDSSERHLKSAHELKSNFGEFYHGMDGHLLYNAICELDRGIDSLEDDLKEYE